jgi:hypothetical protein
LSAATDGYGAVPTPVTGTLSVELAARVFPAFGSPEPVPVSVMRAGAGRET